MTNRKPNSAYPIKPIAVTLTLSSRKATLWQRIKRLGVSHG